MEPTVTTVSTTVAVTVWMTHLATDRLDSVKEDVSRDILTLCAANVRKKS